MGAKGGTTVTKTEPWAEQKPFLSGGMGMAADVFGVPVEAYGGRPLPLMGPPDAPFTNVPGAAPGPPVFGDPIVGNQQFPAKPGPKDVYQTMGVPSQAQYAAGNAPQYFGGSQIPYDPFAAASGYYQAKSGSPVPAGGSQYTPPAFDIGSQQFGGTVRDFGAINAIDYGYGAFPTTGADFIGSTYVLPTMTMPEQEGLDTSPGYRPTPPPAPPGYIWAVSHPKGSSINNWQLIKADQNAPAPYGAKETLMANAPQYFPWETLAQENPYTLLAREMQTQRALSGSPLIGAGQQNIYQTLRGDYLSPGSNPWLDATYGKAAQSAMDQINSQFSLSGMYGASPHASTIMSSLSDLGNQIYGGNYQQERARQQQALGFAPQYAAQDYADIAQLAGVGAAEQARSQAEIQSAMDRWNYYQNLPQTQLADYMDLVSGQYGGTTASKMQPSLMQQILSGLGIGVGALSLLGGPLASLFGGGAASATPAASTPLVGTIV